MKKKSAENRPAPTMSNVKSPFQAEKRWASAMHFEAKIIWIISAGVASANAIKEYSSRSSGSSLSHGLFE